MGDARQFSLSLKKFGDQQPKVVSKLMRAGAFEVMGDLVAASPVDTGRFQSSWFVGVAVPNRSVAPERETKSGAARESLTRLRELTPQTVDGTQPVYLSNNLPYGSRLADGSSEQAPSGWIDGIVHRASVKLDAVKIKVE